MRRTITSLRLKMLTPLMPSLEVTFKVHHRVLPAKMMMTLSLKVVMKGLMLPDKLHVKQLLILDLKSSPHAHVEKV